MKISYLGPIGTYCYEACNLYNKSEYEMIPSRTITDAIDLLLNDKANECVIPIENSIKGTVIETLDNLFENEELFIKQEIILDIKHYLLGAEKYKLQEIEKVYSHPQAIGQCKKYIKNMLSNCEILEVESTAKGAMNISNSKSGACIANKICADIYNLKIIDDNIQDRSNNQTRFFVKLHSV